LSHLGKLNEAISHFSKAIKILPDYAEAHSNLGSALARQSKFDEAVHHYREALRIKPGFADAKHYLKLASRELEKESPSGT
jgi:tetratricopeptide (TPR) repeat protein